MALMHVEFYSNVMGMFMQMDVIIPQHSTGTPGVENSGWQGTYPTLYLLHGMGDDHTVWQRRTSIERYADAKGIAVVMPNGHRSWYTDMHHGDRYFTFMTQELPAICRQFFPNMSTRREDTWVGGLSMGGYGALKMGLNASETFSKVISLSGGLDIVHCINAPIIANKNYWENIFGPADKVPGSQHDLFAAAEQLKASGKEIPDIFMWCGTGDFLYSQNVAMRDHLQKLGYNVTYTESAGDHQWKYWDEHIQDGLNWILP